ncbi:uncharacterized protein LOC144179524 [Haemaphysalis longicornis]
MSSDSSLSAAAGRGLSVSSDEYRVLLPPLPTGNAALNTVFLHCDVSGRPYRINDFEDEMERLGVIQDVASIGAYQMNHVWAVSTHSAAAKHRLVAAKELRIKGKKCLVLDPNDGEIRIKIHWLPYQLSDDVVRKALEPFGKVDRITRETWPTSKFKGAQTSIRSVTITLKNGYTTETLPHQLRIQGGNALVIVPGRSPLCLRCKRNGHIRKNCRIPRCSECRRFGHEAPDCRKTYAMVTGGKSEEEDTEAVMDEEEAEEAAASPPLHEDQPTLETTQSPPVASPPPEVSVEAPRKPGEYGEPEKPPQNELSVSMPTTSTTKDSVIGVEPQYEVSREQAKETALSGREAEEVTEFPALSPIEPEAEDELNEASGRKTAHVKNKWNAPTKRRARFNPAPRVPIEIRRRKRSV